MSHLPPKFHRLTNEEHGSGFVEQVEVTDGGKLEVRERAEYVTMAWDRRWSYVPWTKEQEESCRSLKVRLKGLKAVIGNVEATKRGWSIGQGMEDEEGAVDKSAAKRARSGY